jgi:ACS family hexuronate transporter-like MFS transporter
LFKRIKIKNFRWWIAGLLALATAINYLDRQSLPVVINEVRKTIPVSDVDYSYLQMAFLLAYAIMYAVGGKILDVLGTRIGYTVMIVWWSLANMLHGFVSSLLGLGIARFLLGIGEGGGFPGSAKAVSEWFPAKERSFAFGIFNTGSSLGAVIAPPLIALITMSMGWRYVFILTGAVGIIWAIFWIRIYRKPAKSRYVTTQEYDYLRREEVIDPPVQEAPLQKIPWSSLFKYRTAWGLILMKFFSDSAWYFYIFWLPKYLGDVRDLNLQEIGYYAWIPYAFAGLGSFTGGWFSSFLIRKGIRIETSRKISLGISAMLMPASLFITSAPLAYAIVFFSIAMLGHQFWSTILQTLATDYFPSRIVGSISGLMGSAGSFGAIFFSWASGYLITEYSYGPVFLLAGLLHPLSFFIALLLVKRIKDAHFIKELC